MKKVSILSGCVAALLVAAGALAGTRERDLLCAGFGEEDGDALELTACPEVVCVGKTSELTVTINRVSGDGTVITIKPSGTVVGDSITIPAGGLSASKTTRPLNTPGTLPVTAEFKNDAVPVTLTDTAKVDVVKVESIDATSSKSGISANPPPFAGHTLWLFNVTHSPSPDKHMVVFYKDVIDSSFSVVDFDVTLKANVLPTSITADQLNEVWSKISGPVSGSLNRTDTFEVKYQNPKLGGVYRFDFDLGLLGSVKSEANIVLPLAGAEVDNIVSADIGRAIIFATTVRARYSWLQRQRPANGRRWFVRRGAGDYLGRPDNASNPTVWVYNQVNTAKTNFGMGAVATWKGKPVRLAKISNFMVGYAARMIGVNSVSAWISQTIGTWNDEASSKSWDAGWELADGTSSYDTTVSTLVAEIWDKSDAKNQKLWPNVRPADNYVARSSFRDPDHQFSSPGFLYMTSP